MKTTRLLTAAIVGAIALASAMPAEAQRRSAQQTRAQKTQEIPTCSRNLGTITVMEPETRWWSDYGLSSPEALIKLFVSRSRCFTLVDRGRGMNAMMGERGLAASGELRGRSNVGKGQMRAADYVMVPDLISRNSNAGRTNIGAALGALIGGRAGNLASNVSLNSKTADVLLTVTDIRSSEQVALAEGHAKKTDIGFGGGVGGFLGGAITGSGAGISSYSNTEIGQVITLAYLEAYTKLVSELGGLSGDAPANNAQQALQVQRPATMYKNANRRGGVVRELDPGMMLYPTGNKQGTMWEVEDELGNPGWVDSTLTTLAR
ncbi:peptidoglycan-binding protein [Lysobacteraceae bacterium NML08-0793]|nr:peptidoglycan-binding protein [Xanthomonadaceae bacterium NML08-0793]